MGQLDIYERKIFRAGDVIYMEGDPGACAYVVQSGAVELIKSTPEEPRVMRRVVRGGVFGEKAVLDDRPRSVTAIALQDTVCMVLPRKLLAERLRKSDPLVRAFLNVVVEDLRNVLSKHGGAREEP